MRTPADAAALVHDFLPFEERLVRRDGVHLFGIVYQDGALAHLVDHGVGKLRVKYDPRDLSAVFVELPGGEHVRVPYADISRQPITSGSTVRRSSDCARRAAAASTSMPFSRPSPSSAVCFWKRSPAARPRDVRLHGSTVLNDRRHRSTRRRRGRAGTTKMARPGVPMPLDGETSGVEFW